MTPREASQVLMLAAALDPRLRPPSEDDAVLRASSWATVLDDWIDADLAAWAVREHYRGSADSIMPAHVNAICRQARRVRREREESRRITARQEGVPMPEDFRRQVSTMWAMP